MSPPPPLFTVLQCENHSKISGRVPIKRSFSSLSSLLYLRSLLLRWPPLAALDLPRTWPPPSSFSPFRQWISRLVACSVPLLGGPPKVLPLPVPEQWDLGFSRFFLRRRPKRRGTSSCRAPPSLREAATALRWGGSP